MSCDLHACFCAVELPTFIHRLSRLSHGEEHGHVCGSSPVYFTGLKLYYRQRQTSFSHHAWRIFKPHHQPACSHLTGGNRLQHVKDTALSPFISSVTVILYIHVLWYLLCYCEDPLSISVPTFILKQVLPVLPQTPRWTADRKSTA